VPSKVHVPKMMKAANQETDALLEDGHFEVPTVSQGGGPICKLKKGMIVDEEGDGIEHLEKVDDYVDNSFWIFGSVQMKKSVAQQNNVNAPAKSHSKTKVVAAKKAQPKNGTKATKLTGAPQQRMQQ
jgi:hypothetical protein